jgi:hypothetical protein
VRDSTPAITSAPFCHKYIAERSIDWGISARADAKRQIGTTTMSTYLLFLMSWLGKKQLSKLKLSRNTAPDLRHSYSPIYD